MKKQDMKTFGYIFLAAVVVAVVWFMYSGRGNYLQNQIPSVADNSAPIQTSSDLKNASSQLDETDLNSMDNSLNQLDSEANSF